MSIVNGKIYRITNSIDGKFYIGQTIQKLSKRFSRHKYDAKILNTHLHAAIRKYGIINFKIECLVENIETQVELDNLEKHWIYVTNACDKNIGYNHHEGGNKPPVGRKKTSFQKGHSGLYKKGRTVSEEAKTRMSLWQKGKPKSSMHRGALSKSHMGLKVTEESKRKISASMVGKNTWSKGSKRSEETKEKMRLAQQRRRNRESFRKQVN